MLSVVNRLTAASIPYSMYSNIAVGDRDTAIQWLQRAFDERSVGALWLPMSAVYDPLRRDPRFAVLVQRIAASRP